MLYRVHDAPASLSAIDIHVWGPKGYHHEPLAQRVVLDIGIWTTESERKMDRWTVAQILRQARLAGLRVERFRA